MGVALKSYGKLEEALEAYNKALSIKPNFAQAYNTTALLKVQSHYSDKSHLLFKIDSKIKKLSKKLINAKSNQEIVNYIFEGLSYISEGNFEYKTPLSQIYKWNSVDLNCKRHKKIFHTKILFQSFALAVLKSKLKLLRLLT